MVLIDVLNIRQISVDFALFEFYVNFRGHSNAWFESRMKPGIMTPFITNRERQIGPTTAFKTA